ncbi:MAG: hypothetical protein IT311_07680 [Anaerolineales bacterium]|nr:hypothetical protein [Anaerolineales bacterium]MCZ2120822.1 hypothetical protein [Anaerolineales bacterium]
MRILTAVIAIAVGLLVLLGYFFPQIVYLQTIQALLLNWAMLMLAAATLVGVINLASVHFNKIRRREKDNLFSALLVVFLFGALIFGIIFKPGDAMTRLMLNGLILPVESALMALLAVTLLYAGVRLLRRRADFTSLVFLATAVLVLIGSATLPFGNIPILTDLSLWVKQTLAVGGARGILIGVALGALLTGLRVLFGADRPYGGN